MEHADRKDRDVIDETGRKVGETNPDPITGEPGSHPVGTGIGAAGAGAVGAAIGAVAGPVGALAGAAIGAVVGGLAGHGIAEAVDPTAEEAFWRDEHRTRPYVKEGHTFEEDYAPAYRLGAETGIQHHHRQNHIRSFEAVETDLGATWNDRKGGSRLAWDDAKHAVRDAYDRVGSKLTNATSPGATRDMNTMGSGASSAGVGANRNLGGSSDLSNTSLGFDPEYFRSNFSTRPYCTAVDRFEDFEPAYRYGHTARSRFVGRNWEDVEADLGRDWERNRGTSKLTWERAKLAVRDAWDRLVHH